MTTPVTGRTEPVTGRAERVGGDEAVLRQLYEEVLDRSVVDPHESFFALGGTSLLAVAVLELVDERLGVAVPVEAFYRDPTLAGLREEVHARAVPAPAWPEFAALLATAAAAGPPDRPAVIARDGRLSYAELAELAARALPAAEPAALQVPTTIAGARAVLSAVAARRPVLLLDPAATAGEEHAAWTAFRGDVAAGDPVHAVATSGSTGRPKVVVSPYDGMLAVQRAHAGLHGLGAGDTYLVTPPLHFTFGLKAGMLVGLLSGATVVLPAQPLRPDALRACAASHRITMTIGVSFGYRLLLAADAELPALRRALVGGDALPPDLAAAWRERTGVALMDSYGASEVDHVSDNVELVPGSVGRALPGVELRVRTPDGSAVPSGSGELLVRSPGLARGYAGDPEQTAARFRDGWYHTGDLAELRPDGHLFLRGRLDDQLNVGGAKVDAREVEAACREALDLDDCAVVGVRGSTGIVEVRAYVVAAQPVRRADLARALADRLSPHKIPTRVVQLDALPRAANGKLRREELPR
ncbi:MAG: AMP-binding protein [Pseudonocardia sp.]|nr:AMP-binding protein [Pseudonocardia sp.]